MSDSDHDVYYDPNDTRKEGIWILYLIGLFFIGLDWLADYWIPLILSWVIACFVFQGFAIATAAAVIFMVIVTALTEFAFVFHGREFPWRRTFKPWK